MIYGVGTDLVDVERIAGTLARHGDRFALRVLGPQELVRWRQRSARQPQRGLLYLATRFAAKEAVSKALGLGMRMPMTWRNVEVLNAPSGRPQVVMHGALATFVVERHLSLQVSISDERTMALAFAVAYLGPAPALGAPAGVGERR